MRLVDRPFARARSTWSSWSVLDHVGAQQAGEHRDLADGQGEGRHDHRSEVLERVLGERRPPRGRQPPERHREQVDQQQPHHEAGHRQQPEAGPGDEPVEAPAGPVGGHDAERDGEHEAEDHAHHDDLDRHREPLDDGLGHLLARVVRLPEVAGERVAEPRHVPHRQRVVEAQVLAHRLDGLLVHGVGPQDLALHAAGEQVHHQERQERDRQQHGDDREQLARDDPGHVGAPVLAGRQLPRPDDSVPGRGRTDDERHRQTPSRDRFQEWHGC